MELKEVGGQASGSAGGGKQEEQEMELEQEPEPEPKQGLEPKLEPELEESQEPQPQPRPADTNSAAPESGASIAPGRGGTVDRSSSVISLLAAPSWRPSCAAALKSASLTFQLKDGPQPGRSECTYFHAPRHPPIPSGAESRIQ